MRVFALIAITLLTPIAVHAQQPPAPSAGAQFAAQLTTLLVGTLEERDAARAQLAACQAKQQQPAPEDKKP